MEIEWTGNLNDDCRAELNGIYLHCEHMNGRDWWWAISNQNGDLIESSLEHDRACRSGKAAREAATEAATRYIQRLRRIENSPNKAKLQSAIPSARYSATSSDVAPPKPGDTIYLDQGYTGEDGEPMCLAYMYDETGNVSCSLEVYEAELFPPESDSID